LSLICFENKTQRERRYKYFPKTSLKFKVMLHLQCFSYSFSQFSNNIYRYFQTIADIYSDASFVYSILGAYLSFNTVSYNVVIEDG
jgi:hypothetical protein